MKKWSIKKKLNMFAVGASLFCATAAFIIEIIK